MYILIWNLKQKCKNQKHKYKKYILHFGLLLKQSPEINFLKYKSTKNLLHIAFSEFSLENVTGKEFFVDLYFRKLTLDDNNNNKKKWFGSKFLHNAFSEFSLKNENAL